MMYFSTRDTQIRVTAAQAIAKGLSQEGGLFVPEGFPQVSLEDIRAMTACSYQERARRILSLYLADFTQEELTGFTQAAYGDNYDDARIAPVHVLDGETGVLELWHGPTCAFKDMALQMLPHLLTASLRKNGERLQVCILVATSGDTGKAALEGFRDVAGTSILVFYPRDGVSDIQKLQMTTQAGGNVCVCAVEGNFDDAQTGVKKIFADHALAERLKEAGYFLSSANSINWGRLLPQIAYYFSAYCDAAAAGIVAMGDKLDFCVPTGNFGNILAGWYAKQMGLPVGRLICASNANNVLTDFLATGTYDRNRPFHTTISPSMDILISSNLERLLYALSDEATVTGYMEELGRTGHYSVGDEILSALKADFAAGFCDDNETKAEIRRVWEGEHYLMDTHTAVAAKVLRELRETEGGRRPTVIVSTASPYKFAADVVAALGGSASEEDPMGDLSRLTGTRVPAPLSGLRERPVRFTDCVQKEEMEAKVEAFLKK